MIQHYRCSVPGCGRRAIGDGLCGVHDKRPNPGRDPQAFINERERLLRIDKGTGDTGKAGKSEVTNAQRGALARSTAAAKTEGDVGVTADQERVVRLAPVGYLDRRLPGEPLDLKKPWK